MKPLSDLEKAIAWQRIQQLAAENVTVYGEVIAIKHSAVLVQIQGLRGAINIYSVMSSKFKDVIGSKIPVKIIEVNPQYNRILLTDNKFSREAQMEKFQVGDLVSGTVLGVKPYGVFVDIGNAAALLQKLMVSHHELDRLENFFQEGDEIKAIITFLDKKRCRISLSTKDLEPEPGDMLKNPQLVYDQAEIMVARYRQLVLGKTEPSS